VIPDDVKLLAEPVLAHRIILETEAEVSGATAHQVVAGVLSATVPPAARV
jgi:MoxR-like ATPase